MVGTPAWMAAATRVIEATMNKDCAAPFNEPVTAETLKEFYQQSSHLLKVDDWEDLFLDIYINDLLVYHKQFDKTGRQICYD